MAVLRASPAARRRARAVAAAAAGVAAAATVLVAGCRAATLAAGDDPAAARAHAAAFATAFEQRFTDVRRAPRYSLARERFTRYALAPSKLTPDTALWTALRSTAQGPIRDLGLFASMDGAHYRFIDRRDAPEPVRTGDQRHRMRLQQLGPGAYRWHTEVEHAVGRLPPERAGAVLQAFFASAERPAAAVRADYRAAFPRTTRALGRLFLLDSVITVPQPDGSTRVALHVLVDATRLESTHPAFARYVRKYVEPASYRWRLTDRTGALYLDAQAARKRLVIRFRSRGGALQPLAGPARALPDTLGLEIEGKAKVGPFTVGLSGLHAEFVQIRRPNERGWGFRFAEAPQWDLPLVAERLLSTPLRHPFEGRGISFVLSLRQGSRGQTLSTRTLTVAVRESAITRFMGNLGFLAASDFVGNAEAEENRFLAEWFAAMREDLGVR